MGNDARGRGRTPHGVAALVLLGCAILVAPAEGQVQRAMDARMAAWAVDGPDPTVYSIAFRRSLIGPLDLSARGFGVVDPDSSGRSLYGLGPEITLRLEGGTLKPYGTAGTGLALEFGGSTDVAAIWSAGAGVELRPFSWLGLGVEGRRLVEDRRIDGFWDLDDRDRRGWQVSARLSVRWGGGGSRFAPGRRTPSTGSGRAPAAVPEGEAAALRTSVVETALGVMGEPYRWGGNSTEDGFDCSGLIWYAYGSHGIEIPRVSRSQARIGDYVSPDAARLRPGDILLFGEDGDEVTHVGLYLGERRFIHSTSSGGVTVGRIGAAADANDRWWLRRWIGARRVLTGP